MFKKIIESVKSWNDKEWEKEYSEFEQGLNQQNEINEQYISKNCSPEVLALVEAMEYSWEYWHYHNETLHYKDVNGDVVYSIKLHEDFSRDNSYGFNYDEIRLIEKYSNLLKEKIKREYTTSIRKNSLREINNVFIAKE